MSDAKQEETMEKIICNPVDLSVDSKELVEATRERMEYLNNALADLIKSNPAMVSAANIMILSRQLHAAAISAASRCIADSKYQQDGEGVKLLFVESMGQWSRRPFDILETLNKAPAILDQFIRQEIAAYSDQLEIETKENNPGPLPKGYLFEVFGSRDDCMASARRVVEKLIEHQKVLFLCGPGKITDTGKNEYRENLVEVNYNAFKKLFSCSASRVESRMFLENQLKDIGTLVISTLDDTGVIDLESKAGLTKSDYDSVGRFLERLAQDLKISIVVYRSDSYSDLQGKRQSIEEFESFSEVTVSAE